MGKRYVDMSKELIEGMLTTGNITDHVKEIWLSGGLPEGARLVDVHAALANQPTPEGFNYVRFIFEHPSFDGEIAPLTPMIEQVYDD